jgi:phage recombination protein Bet
MSSLAHIKKDSSIPALNMSENELMTVLQDSVYPGAKPESIKMVINVCRASGKDPLKKPYHIVPMQVSTGNKTADSWDEKVWRDVIMPGINDYRTDAARTGQHAGTSDPEFGEDITEKLGEVTITYPKWCRVTVSRIVGGQVVEFSAKELWKENYATKSSKSVEPNAMWKRRPYAQLAKCAEAQALRKGFPEVGAQPTADEMEGKEIDITSEAQVVREPAKQESTYLDSATFNTLADKYREKVANGSKTPNDFIAWVESKGSLLTDQQRMEVAGWVVKQDKVPDADDPFVTQMNAAEAKQGDAQ